MRSPEAYEKDDIKAYLDSRRPLIWYFIPLMTGWGMNSVPDIVGCHWSKGFFAIEVKRPGKKPTYKQQKRMQDIEAANGKTFWGTSEKVIAEFEAWVA